MWQTLDPRIRTVWMVSSLIVPIVLAIVAAGMILADVPIVPWILGGLAVVLVFLAIFVPVSRWRAWGYQVTDTELIIRFGVMIKVQRWLPRTRIQHVDIVGGPIERSLGLRQVVIYTAGTREADVKIPGLREPIAEQLRADLLSWVETTAPPVEQSTESIGPSVPARGPDDSSLTAVEPEPPIPVDRAESASATPEDPWGDDDDGR